MDLKEKKDEYNDLCTTCISYKTCTGRKNLKRPIWFCEEFDIVSQQDTENLIDTKNSSDFVTDEGENIEQLKGICSNCIHRKTCTFPKPEGGVWHCDEYE